MDKRNFMRTPDKKHTAGFYVNVIFAAESAVVAQLRNRFALNEEVYRVLFTRAPAPKPAQ